MTIILQTVCFTIFFIHISVVDSSIITTTLERLDKGDILVGKEISIKPSKILIHCLSRYNVHRLHVIKLHTKFGLKKYPHLTVWVTTYLSGNLFPLI